MSHHFKIPDNELEFRFSRASGPGGQHINKVETRVQLFFSIDQSTFLSDAVKTRLRLIGKNLLNKEGQLVLSSQCHRSQERNRHACIKKLRHLIESASRTPRRRKKTKPSKAAREKRLSDKKRRSDIKQLRKPIQ